MESREQLVQTIDQTHTTRQLGQYIEEIDYETGEKKYRRVSQVGAIGQALKDAADRAKQENQQKSS